MKNYMNYYFANTDKEFSSFEKRIKKVNKPNQKKEAEKKASKQRKVYLEYKVNR